MCWNHFLTNDLCINISQNILNLWMRLIFPETRHLRLQFEHKNEAIPIIIESDIISPKGKMRSRFMILYQPSLNGIPFIFSPPLLYKPPLSFIQKHTKTPSLLLSWVLVKLSSLVISWSSWDSRYWVRLTLPFLTLLFLHL